MFQMTQQVLFRHCDPAGIVFYPRYFEMINDTVEAFFAAINYPFHEMHNTNGVPTVKISASFTKPSRHGDVLTITFVPTRVGCTSVDLSVACSCADEVRFESSVTLVHITSCMKAERWPDGVRTSLLSHLNPNLEEVPNG